MTTMETAETRKDATGGTETAGRTWRDGGRWRATLLFVGAVAALALLGAVTNVAFTDVRFVAPMFVVVFLAGALGGPLAGFATGGAALGLFALFTGVADVTAVAPALGMAEAGGLAGYLARVRFRRWALARPLSGAVALAALGFSFTLVFSVVADTTEWLLVLAGLVPAAHVPYVGAVVWAGLTFNAGTAAVNALLFPAVTMPVLFALDRLAEADAAGRVVRPLLRRVDGLAWAEGPAQA